MTGNILLFSLGAPEVILIALVVLLIFGGKKNTGTDERFGQRGEQFQKRAERRGR